MFERDGIATVPAPDTGGVGGRRRADDRSQLAEAPHNFIPTEGGECCGCSISPVFSRGPGSETGRRRISHYRNSLPAAIHFRGPARKVTNPE